MNGTLVGFAVTEAHAKHMRDVQQDYFPDRDVRVEHDEVSDMWDVRVYPKAPAS